MKIQNIIVLVIFIVNCSISVFSQNDSLKAVVAKKGDGIYKILRENGYSSDDYYDIFFELNKGKIKNDNTLIIGETYFLPILTFDTIMQNGGQDSVKLFAEISKLNFTDTIKDKKLENAVVYLVSGHGGPDPGAMAKVEENFIAEDEYAYDICMRIARNIEEHGGKVYMIIIDPDDGIRDESFLGIDYDEYCYPDLEIPKNHNERLKQRANAVNMLYDENKDVKYQRVLDIHVDSRDNGAKLDVFFYHCEKSVSGKKFAESIQKVFEQKYLQHQPNRGYGGTVSARNLYVIKNVIPPAILIELGNVQNPRDQKRILSYNNRQALANWITEGIIDDYNNQ